MEVASDDVKVIRVKNFEEGDEVESEVTPEGGVKFKKTKDVLRGRKSKAAGGQFELRVRKDLEGKGWIVDKWSNNIGEGVVVAAKRKFNPFSKVMAIGTGFPDFMAFQLMNDGLYRVIGVEVKMNGTLSREEKDKCRIYLDKKIFSEIWVASKIKEKNRVKVRYVDVREILGRAR